MDVPSGRRPGGGGCPGRPGEFGNHLRSAGRPDPGHRPGTAVDGQPGRLRRGGPHRLEPGGLCRPGTSCPTASGPAGACGSRWNCSICSPPRMNGDGRLWLRRWSRRFARSLAETRRYMEAHLDEPLTISGPEPPGLSLRHHLQGGLPPPVRPARSHLAAAAADGAGGGAAAHVRSKLWKGGQSGGYTQRQSIYRRFPAAIWRDAGPIPKKCLNRHYSADLDDTGGMSAIIFKYAKRLACFRQEEILMKQHRFWAWGAVICMVMVMITGYKRK